MRVWYIVYEKEKGRERGMREGKGEGKELALPYFHNTGPLTEFRVRLVAHATTLHSLCGFMGLTLRSSCLGSKCS